MAAPMPRPCVSVLRDARSPPPSRRRGGGAGGAPGGLREEPAPEHCEVDGRLSCRPCGGAGAAAAPALLPPGPAGGRRSSGIRPYRGGTARLSRGGQQVGIVVRAVPVRVSVLPAGGQAAGQARRVRGGERRGRQGTGGGLPAPLSGALSELLRLE